MNPLTTPPGIDINEEFSRIVNELTRRQFLTGGLAAAQAGHRPGQRAGAES